MKPKDSQRHLITLQQQLAYESKIRAIMRHTKTPPNTEETKQYQHKRLAGARAKVLAARQIFYTDNC